MPLYDIKAVEEFEYHTYYHDIEADSLEEAVELIREGEVGFDDKDEGNCLGLTHVLAATKDGVRIEVPKSLHEPSPTRDDLLGLLRRLHQWERHMGGWDNPVWRDVEKVLGVYEPEEDDADKDGE